MKKIFDFGKIDYTGTGRKSYLVTVEMEYKEKNNGEKVLSICGNIWNTRKTDIVAGGQCLDTIARYIKSPLFKEIYRLWKLYHLNDMHPECEHQAAQGWREQASEKATLYIFTLTTETITAQNSLKRRILNAARNGETMETTAAEQVLLSLEYSVKSETETLPETIAEFYKFKEMETKLCGWLHPGEHSRGILGKACPVCGYKYGHAWNYFPIQEQDEQAIYKLLEG